MTAASRSVNPVDSMIGYPAVFVHELPLKNSSKLVGAGNDVIIPVCPSTGI